MTKQLIGSERDVATHLARERKRRGWSLSQIAARLTEAGWPVGSGTLSKLENGRPGVALRVDHLVAIVEVLGISADELLTPIELIDEAEAKSIAEGAFTRIQELHDAASALQADVLRLDELAEHNPDAYVYVVRQLHSMVERSTRPELDDLAEHVDEVVSHILHESLDRRGLRAPYQFSRRGAVSIPNAEWLEAQTGAGADDGER